MKNPFEVPKKPQEPEPEPEPDLSIDIDFDEEAPHPKGDPAMRGAKVDVRGRGLQRVESKATLEFRHAMTGGEEGGPNPYETVANAFFGENPLLKAKFERDPETMRRFKVGLAGLVEKASRDYQLAADELPGDRRFRKDLLKFSMEFEDEEDRRRPDARRAGRASA